ncbi:MAG: 6-carboxytetrahydropterin synthase [Gammaproteobacteria bacterium]|nr:MAG: 6-carboxytetrahydropterin synthase [Gammaproteobacteria bacterium]
MPRLFVEQLCTIDFAWLQGDRGLLGDTWIVDADLEGDLDEQGMIFDFAKVKPTIKAVLDEVVDHRLLVPLGAPRLEIERNTWEIRLLFRYGDRQLRHRSPPEAVCLIDSESISADAVGRHLESAVLPELPDNVKRLRLGLREESIDGPWYRYAHGLRQHEGNCQRIAHGHRSRIRILRDGQRCEATERWLADRWRDIYLGCSEDLTEEVMLDGVSYRRFAYRAPQGEFELLLEAQRSELLDTESTVECIADYVLRLLKERDKTAEYEVRAYEGLNKGAVASG